ncbi:aldose 1-epimerase family protein [Flavobacterium sp. XS2P39]|uniref:aldose 1-epimerase family protein n=1 Tax=Flavobacterium sp. XS2P39 TaxID=3401725 RepID=UPI003AABE881
MTTTIKNSNLIAEIKHLGAELISLKTNLNKEYIWEGNPYFWGKHSPILFPIVGTLKNNSFHYDGIKYHLSRHGFARDMEFKLVDKKENSATFSIQSSEETLKAYPFAFELQIIYTLEASTLLIEYKVSNKGKSSLPFSIGAHPAFALPGKFENYSIAFEKEEALEYYLLDNDLISNKTKKIEAQNKQIPLTYELFENDALIFKTLESNSLTILKNENPVLRVQFEDFPNLGIWTKRNAPFLCIEPWFGYSDTNGSSGDLFEKEGIQILEANAVFTSKFSIEIL